jgi:hypothetical protein
LYTANSPTIGNHQATVTVKLSLYPSKTVTLDTFTIIIQPCLVTAVQIVLSAGSVTLTDSVYWLDPQNPYLTTVVAQQTPNCGYSASGWSTSVTGPQTLSFTNYGENTDFFNIRLPYYHPTDAGAYTIQIATVTINSISYV